MEKNVILKAITNPVDVEGATKMTPEDFIVYCARVSNPSNQMNTMSAPKLIKYMLDHKHFSPFEMVNLVFEINTTRDIGRQIIRHGLKFQEFSQRFSDPSQLGFVIREARLQDPKNRQNSISSHDEELQKNFARMQHKVIAEATEAYDWAIKNGIAKEQARVVLPEGLTKSRMYMSGTLRNFIHWIQVRFHPDTQREHRELAVEAHSIIVKEFPSLDDYMSRMIQENYPFIKG